MAEDRAVVDRVVHHLLVPGAIADKISVCLGFLTGPLLLPDRIPVLIHSLDLRHIYAACGAHIGQDGTFGYKVAYHYKAAATDIQGAEKSLLDPIGQILHALFISAQLVIVKVIDHDIVRARLAVTQTAWRLTATYGEKLGTALGLEFALGPFSEILLLTEVRDDALVEL